MKQTSCPDSGDPKPVLPGWVGVCGAGMEDAVCRLQALPHGSCSRAVPLSRPSALADPFPSHHLGVGWGVPLVCRLSGSNASGPGVF